MPLILGILAQGVGAAPGAAGAYDLLETQVLTTTTASVTFTGLGSYSNYKHLQVRFTGRLDWANNGSTHLYTNLNADSTGANYASHRLFGNGTTVTSASSVGAIPTIGWESLVGNNAGAGKFGAGVIDFLDFSSTDKNTTIRSLSGSISDAENYVSLNSAVWLNTAAVTEIKLYHITLSLLAGSRFSLYGVK